MAGAKLAALRLWSIARELRRLAGLLQDSHRVDKLHSFCSSRRIRQVVLWPLPNIETTSSRRASTSRRVSSLYSSKALHFLDHAEAVPCLNFIGFALLLSQLHVRMLTQLIKFKNTLNCSTKLKLE
jgi:hypothetical protein